MLNMRNISSPLLVFSIKNLTSNPCCWKLDELQIEQEKDTDLPSLLEFVHLLTNNFLRLLHHSLRLFLDGIHAAFGLFLDGLNFLLNFFLCFCCGLGITLLAFSVKFLKCIRKKLEKDLKLVAVLSSVSIVSPTLFAFAAVSFATSSTRVLMVV